MTKTPKDEMETHVWYDYMDNTLTLYTNVPKHITAMTKLWGKPHQSTPCGKTWILDGDRFKPPRPKRKLSDKQLKVATKSITKANRKENK